MGRVGVLVRAFQRLGLYNANWNQVRQTWNFNRLFLLLGFRMRLADSRLTMLLGESRGPQEWELSSRVYRPWNTRSSRWSADDPFDVVVVAQHGRFGNMIRQLSLAIGVAERMGVREVLVKSLPEFPTGTWALDNGVALTHDPFLRTRMIARPRLALGGDFFVKPRLPIDTAKIDFDVIGRSLFDALDLGSVEPLDESTLVIHFRSGDAFTTVPHPNLGQPPLAFYKKLIARENPTQVALVFEDTANPVIHATQQHLTDLGIPFTRQSSGFREDLRLLLRARKLVTARGTLAEALLLLSPHIRRWIHFGEPKSTYFRRQGIQSVVSIRDSDGRYSEQILDGTWKNSDAQRSLMMSFPAENLELVERNSL